MTHQIGIIGAGAISQTAHIPGFVAAGCTIAGIADPRAACLDELRERKLPTAPRFDDHRALLASARFDAVAISCPNAVHAEAFIACCEAGVPLVLLEKPVALTLAQAEAMRAAQRASGTRALVAFSHRFNTRVQALRQALLADAIGAPYQARIRFAHQGPIPGWARTGWFYDPTLAGGGALLDMGIHALDLVRWLLGESRTISARVATLRKTIAVDDNAICLLELDRCLVTVEAGWTSPAGFVGIEVMGDRGSLVLDYQADQLVQVVGQRSPDGTSSSERTVLPPLPGASHWGGQMAAFCAALDGAPLPGPDLEDGIAALRLALAAMESSRSGRRVTLE
jgi:UDP-N-acetylglucosamine 3-dehydrogenase